MKKIISFCLWGDNPKYTIGAVKNQELATKVYPGWICRFYCASSVPREIISTLESLGAEIVMMDTEGDWRGMFWRFLAIGDYDVDIMISRDTDSRLSLRESSAVNEWLSSDRNFHVMRDHPSHTVKIMGGMWGVRKPLLGNITDLIDDYNKGNHWQVDQEFLESVIWPIVKNSAFIHDSFFEGTKFPKSRQKYEFVGQVWDEDDNPNQDYIKQLKNYNAKKVSSMVKNFIKSII